MLLRCAFSSVLLALSLISSSTAASLQLTVLRDTSHGNAHTALIKLTEKKTGQPIILDALQTVHTQKIHLLIIDDSLTDYTHTHPKATKTPGVYALKWQARYPNAHYTLWADVTQARDQQQAFLLASLTPARSLRTTIDTRATQQQTMQGYVFKLTFSPTPLQAGKRAKGTLTITDSKGHPVERLRPVMGAFAHLVGFSDDLRTVVHIHPMGKEPRSAQSRGGPVLPFHVRPQKPGFIKLFAQVNIDGKELYVPFGLTVLPRTH